MLTRNRPAMAERARRAFHSQTYENKVLVVWDTSADPNPPSIGVLRNDANSTTKCDILVHWDDDDWSHPQRIAEQVALLQSSGKQCVGYREAPFFDTRKNYGQEWLLFGGAAWLFSSPDPRYVLGTSMCYWRRAWEQLPFDDAQHEDQRWWLRNASLCKGVSALRQEPRMVCEIHGKNTEAYDPAVMARAKEWTRTRYLNPYCRTAMTL